MTLEEATGHNARMNTADLPSHPTETNGKRPMRTPSGGYSRPKGKPSDGSTAVPAVARIGAG